ncbi:MAG: DUF2231 domain-containing protein [Piscirickettsiaceae bacterium]|nr:DUF2231 domain-containing protein [Piscirickettsiaceae bacterium]
MPEIVPNFHPILVHFTIALLSISVVFYVARLLLSVNHNWREQWLNMANWSLWTGCLFAVVTVIAGWFAYNSVAHDMASHAAMTLHRNWAIPTAVLFLLIGFSSIRLAIVNKLPGFKFISVSIVAVIMLMVTGWLGAEAVYRYGLGVMSLPKVEAGADGHNHSHEMTPDKRVDKTISESMQPMAEDHGNNTNGTMEEMPVQAMPSSDGHNHAH